MPQLNTTITQPWEKQPEPITLQPGESRESYQWRSLTMADVLVPAAWAGIAALGVILLLGMWAIAERWPGWIPFLVG
ncbi:MAG: hypothetical protein EHM35_21400, partial [Planctomycetaceae bacterium]